MDRGQTYYCVEWKNTTTNNVGSYKYFENDMKNMKFTMYNNKSFFGFSSQVLKSGICKYFRRNIEEKFKWCVMEMLLFGIDGKALLTNLLNRLKILLMEDVSLFEIEKIYECIIKLEDFEKSGRNDIYKIMEFCNIVISSKKNRVVSWINNWYKNNDIEQSRIN